MIRMIVEGFAALFDGQKWNTKYIKVGFSGLSIGSGSLSFFIAKPVAWNQFTFSFLHVIFSILKI